MRTPVKEADRAIEHCEKHIAWLRVEIERRQTLGEDSAQHQRRLETLEAVLHATERASGNK